MKPITISPDEIIAGKAERTPSVRWALACLALCMLLSSLGISSPNVALPTLAQAFSATFQEVQWIIIAYLLAMTITIVIVGRIGDIIGHRPMLTAGIALFTTASILCGFAPTLWILLGGRAVQGIGAAILMALTVALVRETVPKARTGSAMGLLGTMSAIGTALGPSIGGVLVAGPGWRTIFLLMAPLGVLNFFLARRGLPVHIQRVKTERNGFDRTGTLLLALTLATYALTMTVGGGRFSRLNMVLLLAAVLGGSLFVYRASRVGSPLIPLAALGNALLSASLAMNALVSTVMMATLVIGPFYLSRALGLDDAQVGIVMAIGPMISMLSGVPAGRLVDRLGAPALVVVGLIELAAGSFALALLPAMFGIAGYISGIAILTPGYQIFQAANNTAVMMDGHPDQRGVTSGLLSLSRNLGLITGASVMGGVFAFASRAADITAAPAEAVATGMQLTFAVAAVLVLAALAIAIGSRALAKRPPRPL